MGVGGGRFYGVFSKFVFEMFGMSRVLGGGLVLRCMFDACLGFTPHNWGMSRIVVVGIWILRGSLVIYAAKLWNVSDFGWGDLGFSVYVRHLSLIISECLAFWVWEGAEARCEFRENVHC